MGVESLLCLAGVTIIKAKLALGEDYLGSDIFDGFNYVGGSVVRRSNVASQSARLRARHFRRGTHHSKSDRQPDGACDLRNAGLAGPFRIQDLGDSVSGTLHIRIEEQNGEVQEYDISTASMPYHSPEVRFAIRS